MDQEKVSGNYDDYNIDDWIAFMTNKMETTSDPEKKKEYKVAINEMIQIRDDVIVSNINDDVFTSIRLINTAMNNVFDDWQYNIIEYDDSVLLYNDIVYISLYFDTDHVNCDLGFGYNSDPDIIAEITLIFSSIFGLDIGIINGCFYVNDLDNTFIWGKDNISEHLNKIKGYKTYNPVIVYDNENIGNC